jgi:N-acetylglutamate synthase
VAQLLPGEGEQQGAHGAIVPLRYNSAMTMPSLSLSAADIESIERATLAAMPPAASEELEGWLLAFDSGTVGRAHSGVPLRHDTPDTRLLEVIEGRYASRALPVVLRLPRIAAFTGFGSELSKRSWNRSKPTLVQVARAADVATLPSAAPVALATAITDPWTALFLGEGFDPVDAKSRLGILGRAQSSLFASVVLEGRIAAVGSACFSQGWASVHGMRTAPAFRGNGLAGSILSAFAGEATTRGMERIFLQVEEGNLAAQSLYRRAGFTSAWAYDYWKQAVRPSPPSRS